MERKTTNPITKLYTLALALMLFVPLASDLFPHEVSSHNPCGHGCGYTFKNGCCIPAPWSECPEIC
ncbi:MAG TPA: hypothetical protein VGX68_22995 [Thermoanaerobaculia bacterium]|nr:hypothetical protein [Thermoanaerobaculia bacterium]